MKLSAVLEGCKQYLTSVEHPSSFEAEDYICSAIRMMYYHGQAITHMDMVEARDRVMAEVRAMAMEAREWLPDAGTPRHRVGTLFSVLLWSNQIGEAMSYSDPRWFRIRNDWLDKLIAKVKTEEAVERGRDKGLWL